MVEPSGFEVARNKLTIMLNFAGIALEELISTVTMESIGIVDKKPAIIALAIDMSYQQVNQLIKLSVVEPNYNIATTTNIRDWVIKQQHRYDAALASC